MADEGQEWRTLTSRPRFFLQQHDVPPISKQRWHPFLSLFLLFLCFFSTQDSKFTQFVPTCMHATNYITNSLRNNSVSMPLFRKQHCICLPTVCGTTSGWCKASLILFHPSPEIRWSWWAAPFFSYGNDLAGWLGFAPRWPCHSKCSVISLHSFTYSQNTSNNSIQWCWPFLS